MHGKVFDKFIAHSLTNGGVFGLTIILNEHGYVVLVWVNGAQVGQHGIYQENGKIFTNGQSLLI